jgi:hypothetical protein
MEERTGVRILRNPTPQPGYWFAKVVGSRRIIACKNPAALSRYMRVHGMRWDPKAPTDYYGY